MDLGYKSDIFFNFVLKDYWRGTDENMSAHRKKGCAFSPPQVTRVPLS